MRFRIGCDIGGTNVKMGLVDEAGKVTKNLVLASPSREEPLSMVACLKKGCEALAQGRKVAGMGIGIAGVIDFGKGIVHTSPNLPRWREVPLQRMVEKSLGIRVKVDNDANAVILGEVIAGAGRGARHVAGLTLGTGVGGGLVIDGRLYRGARGGAGEIGHTSVQANGPKCRCGSRGCLETYVGAGYLVRRYRDLKRMKAESPDKDRDFASLNSRHKAEDKENITPAVIAERARKGERTAVQVLQEAGEWLGVACANLVNLLQPEVIVIGGGVAGSGEILFNAIRKTVRERAFEASSRTVRIVPGKLKEKAGIIGAAALIES